MKELASIYSSKIVDDILAAIRRELDSFRKYVLNSVKYQKIGPDQITMGAITSPKFADGAVTKRAIDPNYFPEMAKDIEDAVDAAKDDIDEAKQRLNSAEGRLTDAEGNVSLVQASASQLTSDMGTVQGDVSTLKQTATGLTTAVANANGEISTIKQNATSLTLAVQGKLDANNPSVGVVTSGIDIRSNQVSISTPVFGINVSGSAGDTVFDEEGLSVPVINSASVAAVYLGPSTVYVDKNATDAQVEAGTHYRSVQSLFNALNRRHLRANLTINITNATYYESDVNLTVYGGYWINIMGNGAKLPATQFLIRGCTCPISVYDIDLGHRNNTSHGFYAANCLDVRFFNCKATAKPGTISNYACYQFDRVAAGRVATSEAYSDGGRAIRVLDGVISALNNKGNAKLGCDGGLLLVAGTQPDSATSFAPVTANAGQVLGTATVDFGSATPAEQETATQTFAATTMRTMYGTGDWPATWMSNQNYALQGYTDGAKSMYASLWFQGLSALAGKTIKEAKVTLRRITPTGRSGPVKINGYYGELGNTAGSGAPSSRVSMGLLGTLELPETKTFSIPAAAVSYLAGAPTGRCLMLNPKDSTLWNGKNYSENHARLAGVGSSYVPELEVTYVP